MALQYMTQEGLDKLKKELAEAIAQRPVISAQIAEARDKGDLSENAEYEAAREAQGLLELNIVNLSFNTHVNNEGFDIYIYLFNDDIHEVIYAGETILVPAILPEINLVPNGKSKVLEIYMPEQEI